MCVYIYVFIYIYTYAYIDRYMQTLRIATCAPGRGSKVGGQKLQKPRSLSLQTYGLKPFAPGPESQTVAAQIYPVSGDKVKPGQPNPKL